MNYYYLNASQFYFYELMRGRSYGSHKELMEKLAPTLRIEQYFCLYFLDGRIFIIGSSYELSDILAGVMAYDGIKLLDYNWENFEALAGYGIGHPGINGNQFPTWIQIFGSIASQRINKL